MNRSHGFTLIECLVAMTVGLAVLGAFFDVALDIRRSSAAQLASVDVSQRARASLTVLSRAVEGAGTAVGEGPVLSRLMPAVWPRWVGPVGEDPEVSASSERLSVLAAAGRAIVPVAAPSAGGVVPVAFVRSPYCPTNDATCGFVAREPVLLVDALGRFDLFRLESAGPALVVPAGPGKRHAYDPTMGARLAPARLDQFAFDAARRQLRWSNGFSTSLPVADDVVGFEVRYFGDVRAPSAPRPPPGVANCLYDAGGVHLDPAGEVAAPALVEIPLVRFTDGPFCGAVPNRFDVDLLRVRLVRVRLRVQTAEGALRGRDGRFAVAGWARDVTVPDVEWTIDVSPPGL